MFEVRNQRQTLAFPSQVSRTLLLQVFEQRPSRASQTEHGQRLDAPLLKPSTMSVAAAKHRGYDLIVRRERGKRHSCAAVQPFKTRTPGLNVNVKHLGVGYKSPPTLYTTASFPRSGSLALAAGRDKRLDLRRAAALKQR